MQLNPIWIDYSISRMYEAFEDSTVAEIVSALCKLDCGKNCAKVSIMGDSWREVMSLAHLPLHRTKAKYIKVEFWGGPPGKQTIFSGSLVTMLMDRLMQDSLNHPAVASESNSEN